MTLMNAPAILRDLEDTDNVTVTVAHPAPALDHCGKRYFFRGLFDMQTYLFETRARIQWARSRVNDLGPGRAVVAARGPGIRPQRFRVWAAAAWCEHAWGCALCRKASIPGLPVSRRCAGWHESRSSDRPAAQKGCRVAPD